MKGGPLTRRRLAVEVGGAALLFLSAALLCPLFGAESLNWKEALSGQGPAGAIFFFQRLPRVILGLLAGGGLALAGASFQALLRNPLATPFTLGVSGAPALGASLALWIPALSARLGPLSGPALAAWAFALAEVALVDRLARTRSGGFKMDTLLLAGVTLGLICSAAILGIRYIVSPDLLVEMDRWLMGGLTVGSWSEPASVLPLLLPSSAVLLLLARDFNHLAFGEETASARGVDPARTRRRAFLAGSLATASVVSVTGPIGFVGLLVPHAVRLLIGPDHRALLPCSFLAGGALLAWCDTLARTAAAPTEIPVGLFTALLGGPLFLWLLLREKG